MFYTLRYRLLKRGYETTKESVMGSLRVFEVSRGTHVKAGFEAVFLTLCRPLSTSRLESTYQLKLTLKNVR